MFIINVLKHPLVRIGGKVFPVTDKGTFICPERNDGEGREWAKKKNELESKYEGN